MRAILIDVENKCLEDIDISPEPGAAYDVLGYKPTAGVWMDNVKGHMLYVDAHSLTRDSSDIKGGFWTDYYKNREPLFNSALIVGYDNGRQECTLSLLEVSYHLQFISDDKFRTLHTLKKRYPPPNFILY